MLTDAALQQILQRLPGLTIGVIGDLFLDRYLDIDGGLTEPSLETGLDAYQVTRVRSYPGAAGTIINNLAALGVKAAVRAGSVRLSPHVYNTVDEIDRTAAALGRFVRQPARP